MTCVHKVRWSVKRPENCRFRLSVSHYKDRIVAPDEYSGATEVTPSDSEQVLPTTDKLVRDDITINPAPTEVLSTDHNGTFTPSDGKVGFSQVDVNVVPDLRPLSVSDNGQYSPDDFDGYSDVTVDVEPNLTSLAVTENGLYLPESGVDGFDRVNVDVPVPSGSIEIVQNGTYDVASKETAVVVVPQKWDLNSIADQSAVYGDVVLETATLIRENFFYGANIDSIIAPLVTDIGNYSFRNSTIKSGTFATCKNVGDDAFRDISGFAITSDFISDFPKIETIQYEAFRNTGFRKLIFPDTLQSIPRNYAFMNCWEITEIKFLGAPTTINATTFANCNKVLDIYVPWSSGAVANAPWGARNATIHYDTVYDSEWNVISST